MASSVEQVGTLRERDVLPSALDEVEGEAACAEAVKEGGLVFSEVSLGAESEESTAEFFTEEGTFDSRGLSAGEWKIHESVEVFLEEFGFDKGDGAARNEIDVEVKAGSAQSGNGAGEVNPFGDGEISRGSVSFMLGKEEGPEGFSRCMVLEERKDVVNVAVVEA